MPYVDLIFPESTNGGGITMPMMDVSKITRKWLDVDYTPQNPHPSRKLDVYLPENGDGPFPTLICMHGGAFWAGDKRDMQNLPFMEAIPNGFAVVCVEQRLCTALSEGGYSSEGLFPNPIFDFKAAIRYLRKNADLYSLDPNRFALAGASAGGYHVLIAAASADNDALYDLSLGYEDVSDAVSAVVSWFAVGDLVLQSEFCAATPYILLDDGTKIPMDNFADIFLGVNAQEHKNLAHFANPNTWITKKMPPTLIQHGDADTVTPVEGSREVYETIRNLCTDAHVVYDEFPGYAHGDPGFSNEENISHIINWLKKTL